jgi:hypothetical protein
MDAVFPPAKLKRKLQENKTVPHNLNIYQNNSRILGGTTTEKNLETVILQCLIHNSEILPGTLRSRKRWNKKKNNSIDTYSELPYMMELRDVLKFCYTYTP